MQIRTEPASSHLSASEAALQLGVSIKALRLYEKQGLLNPARSASGWRAYGPAQMTRAADIVTLRKLGFSLAQIARVLAGDSAHLRGALNTHLQVMEARLRDLGQTLQELHALHERCAHGETLSVSMLRKALHAPDAGASAPIAFDLPWPWGGERFELPALRPFTYITGPLGSGKTRLAMRLAEALPDATFLGLDRARNLIATRAMLASDAALQTRVDHALDWLIEDGASVSDDLIILLAAFAAEGGAALVIDMIEQGLDEATQQALAAHLRRRPTARPLIMLTRSSAVLDLSEAAPDAVIVFCPANHSPPICVTPFAGAFWPGATGYEAIASCLAAPEVRMRTHGMTAMMPGAT